MKKIIVLFGVIVCSYSSSWNFGNHGELTLGEISLDHHDLGAFNLGETESHSLNFLGDHSPLLEEIGNRHLGINNFHGFHVIPVVKHIGVPTIKTVPISVSHPVVQTVPQPYPVTVVIPKPVPYEVEKHIIKTVEKKVLTPVEKIIPVKIEKPVPFHVVKHVPVPIEKPIPIKIPIYKTVLHKVKSH